MEGVLVVTHKVEIVHGEERRVLMRESAIRVKKDFLQEATLTVGRRMESEVERETHMSRS